MKKVNSNFFSKPNLLNSYWAGFIAADGCIIEHSTYSPKLVIGLSQKDIEHLKLFKKQLKSEHKLCKYSVSRKLQGQKEYKIYHTCSIYITNRKLVEDLKRVFKIAALKSNRERFPKLSVNNLKAFLIGYIDGDGSIGIPYRNPNCRVLKILGSKIFLNKIKSFMNSIFGINILAKVRKETNNIYSITIEGTYIKPMLENLKSLNVPKLTRKWNKI